MLPAGSLNQAMGGVAAPNNEAGNPVQLRDGVGQEDRERIMIALLGLGHEMDVQIGFLGGVRNQRRSAHAIGCVSLTLLAN